MSTNEKLKANAHEDYWSFTLISLILPVVGFILGIVYLAKNTRVDKKLGEHLLAVSVLSAILWGVGLQLTVFKNGPTASTNQQGQLQALSNTADNIEQRSRDEERRADLMALQGQLEAYFATNGYYPSINNLGADSTSNVSFITTNMQGLDKESLRDPLAPAGDYSLANKLTSHKYSYTTSGNGQTCDNDKVLCNKYVLSAQSETGGIYTYNSLN